MEERAEMTAHYGKGALGKASRVLCGVVVPSKVMSERCECVSNCMFGV